MSVKEIKENEVIYRLIMKGKDIKISDVISYPASGLDPDKSYLVTISRVKEVKNE